LSAHAYARSGKDQRRACSRCASLRAKNGLRRIPPIPQRDRAAARTHARTRRIVVGCQSRLEACPRIRAAGRRQEWFVGPRLPPSKRGRSKECGILVQSGWQASLPRAEIDSEWQAITKALLEYTRIGFPRLGMSPKRLAAKVKNFRAHPPLTESFERALRERGTWGRKPVWYRSQKEHWLGWLSEYDGAGYYGRKSRGLSAQFAYNHIMCPPMLLWIAEASGISKKKVLTAKQSALSARPTLASQCAAIRKSIPWSEIDLRLEGK